MARLARDELAGILGPQLRTFTDVQTIQIMAFGYSFPQLKQRLAEIAEIADRLNEDKETGDDSGTGEEDATP